MKLITFIKGAAVGAGMMYLFDPSQGRKRRARIRDRAVHAWNETGDTIEGKARDLANRAQGVAHDATAMITGAGGLARGGASQAWMPSNWSPTTRMLVTAGAGLLALYGKRKGGIIGTALGAVSVGIITNSVSARELRNGFSPAPALPSDLATDQESDAQYAGSLSEHMPRAWRT